MKDKSKIPWNGQQIHVMKILTSTLCQVPAFLRVILLTILFLKVQTKSAGVNIFAEHSFIKLLTQIHGTFCYALVVILKFHYRTINVSPRIDN